MTLVFSFLQRLAQLPAVRAGWFLVILVIASLMSPGTIAVVAAAQWLLDMIVLRQNPRMQKIVLSRTLLSVALVLISVLSGAYLRASMLSQFPVSIIRVLTIGRGMIQTLVHLVILRSVLRHPLLCRGPNILGISFSLRTLGFATATAGLLFLAFGPSLTNLSIGEWMTTLQGQLQP